MTKLLEKALEQVRKLPDERQDEVAECLFTLVAQNSADRPQLTPEQHAEVRRRRANPVYASDEEVTAFFKKAGV